LPENSLPLPRNRQKSRNNFIQLRPGKWKRLNFYESGSTLKKEAESELESIWLFEEPEAFFIKYGAGMWKRTLKHLTLYGAGSGSKNYSTASTSLVMTSINMFTQSQNPSDFEWM